MSNQEKPRKKYRHLRHRYFILSVQTDLEFSPKEKDNILKCDKVFKEIFMDANHSWLNVKDDDVDKNLKNIDRLAYMGAMDNGLSIAQILVHATFYDKLTIDKPHIKKQFRLKFPGLNYKLKVEILTKGQYSDALQVFRDAIGKLYVNNKEDDRQKK